MASAMGSGADPDPGHRPGPQERSGLELTAPFNLHSVNCPDHPNSHHRSSPILSLSLYTHATKGCMTCCCCNTEQSWRETGLSARLSRLACRPIIALLR
eukprot:6212183-Pleurochrysis_carterae.AAC.1